MRSLGETNRNTRDEGKHVGNSTPHMEGSTLQQHARDKRKETGTA